MKRYLMVGAGGTGTHLLPQLITYLSTFHREEDWQLGVMDGDSVERHNLERQLFVPQSVSMPKAKAALLPYSAYNNIVAITDYLGPENIEQFIKDGDTILICVDNFPVRALIESHCNGLSDVVVINGGNERDTGTCQIWVRKDGSNITPALSFGHPEIFREGKLRSDMTCEEVAKLPGGEQLIVTNMASAMYMLNSLMAVNEDRVDFTEIEFDLMNPKYTTATDYRVVEGWN